MDENEAKQINGLRTHAYTVEGKSERLEAQLNVCIKPNTMARLKLLSQSYEHGHPLVDQMVVNYKIRCRTFGTASCRIF